MLAAEVSPFSVVLAQPRHILVRCSTQAPAFEPPIQETLPLVPALTIHPPTPVFRSVWPLATLQAQLLPPMPTLLQHLRQEVMEQRWCAPLQIAPFNAVLLQEANLNYRLYE